MKKKKYIITILIFTVIFITFFFLLKIFEGLGSKEISNDDGLDIENNIIDPNLKLRYDMATNKIENINENDIYSIIGIFQYKGEDFITITNNPNYVFTYKDFNCGTIKISKDTPIINYVTGEKIENLNTDDWKIVMTTGKGEIKNNEYIINSTNSSINVIMKSDIENTVKTFLETKDNVISLKNVEYISVDNYTQLANPNANNVDMILYIDVKDKKIPYYIQAVLDENTIIENEGTSNTASVELKKIEYKTTEYFYIEKITYK